MKRPADLDIAKGLLVLHVLALYAWGLWRHPVPTAGLATLGLFWLVRRWPVR